MSRLLMTLCVGAGLVATGPAAASAFIAFDQDVKPDTIFGSGNVNGAFTTARTDSVELGLRAKLRFNEFNAPENTFNSNGDGTYSFLAGLPPGPPVSTTTAIWNFEWSINTDFDGDKGRKLADLTYALDIDYDPGPGTNFLSFDPIALLPPLDFYWDHAIGDNNTGNGGGSVASNRTEYTTLIANNNVAQNSWNLDFFDDGNLFPFDGRNAGVYDIRLSAFDTNEQLVASTSISVISVSEPTPWLLMASFAGLLIVGWKFRPRPRTVRRFTALNP